MRQPKRECKTVSDRVISTIAQDMEGYGFTSLGFANDRILRRQQAYALVLLAGVDG